MPTKFTPRLDCLPPPQRDLWPRLGEVPEGFVLYGGTALALHLGHRQSEDFDFFSSEPFDPQRLFNSLSLLKGAAIEQTAANTLSVALPDNHVRLSFFGGLAPGMRAVFEAVLADNGVSVASVGDVFGCKCAAVQSRATFKDYFDLAAILEQTDWTLADGLSFAAAIYGEAFTPHATLYALAYFDDLDSPLPAEKQAVIRAAAQSVDLATLPSARPQGPIQAARRPE